VPAAVLQNDAMMADHPTSVVRNLQFLSQAMSPLKPSAAGAGAAASGTTTQKRRLRSHHGARDATDPDTATPTVAPTSLSTDAPTVAPTTVNPTVQPTAQPTSHPTPTPTQDTAGSVASAVVDINAKAEANHAIRVLLYSGEFDLNCNTLGTLHTLEANRWRNK
jgi:cell division protein FtsN